MNKFIELIREEIHAGVSAEDVLNAAADATVPLIVTLSTTSNLSPAQVVDYFQYRQDSELANFLQVCSIDYQQTN